MGISLDCFDPYGDGTSLYDVSMSMHVHTRYSDGGCDLPDIVEAAQASGLDVVVLADHNHQRLRKLGAEGWYGNILVLIGQEQGWRSCHVLTVGHDEELPAAEDNVRSQIANCRLGGGLAFAAHPNASGARWLNAREQRWTHGLIPGLHGLEVWCMMHDWIRKVTPWNLRSSLASPGDFLSGPLNENLSLWDQWSRQGRCIGIGSTDNHARRVMPGTSLRAVEHEQAFRCIRTHALLTRPLTGHLAGDRKLILDALRAGNVYVARDDLSDPDGVFCWISDGQRRWTMGDEVSAGKGLRLHVSSPVIAEWTMVQDGTQTDPIVGDSITWPVSGSGVYRLEARLQDASWILMNPFRVGLPDVDPQILQ